MCGAERDPPERSQATTQGEPIGTAMLVDAAGGRPGRAIGINGVFGNIGVGAGPVLTAFLASRAGRRPAFIVPGTVCIALGFVVETLAGARSCGEARRGDIP